MRIKYLNIDDEAVVTLRQRDPKLNQLIKEIGNLEIELRTDYFASLVRSIVGQQISVTAATTIYQRLKNLLKEKVSAESILEKSPEQLREVGLTKRKVEYVKDLSDKVLTKQININQLDDYSDQEVIETLMKVKGIGQWTAEMFLILTLGRDDVLAIGDVGIQRAARWLYDVDKSKRREILIEKSPLWQPYRSVVSFYLWEAIHLDLVTDEKIKTISYK
ncbi:MAG TPA: DNA-3-methyladenine glycosylase 2 family protein [Pseudogracilibacillus sp.]|nr:DNA-3-methyladenine glycosylase 2 family protein [Pseudogracilibacillus sp.]